MIVDVLVKEKKISQQQAEEVRLEHLQTGKPEEVILKEKGWVSEQEIAKARAKAWGIPWVDLNKVAFAPQALSLVPQIVAQRYQLIPFRLNTKTNTLSVAMANPVDVETIEFLEKKTQKRIAPFAADPAQIRQAIEEQYRQELPSEVKKALAETQPKRKTAELEKLTEVIKEAPIAKIVTTILEYAIKARASDIHIEPGEDHTRVRYRIDGILHEKLILPKRVHDAVVSRIKILANMKIDEKRIPQDGRFTFTADGEEVDLRVSTAPTVFGEKVVMRLLKKQMKIPTLPELGLRGKALRDLQEAISRPQGLIIICGPTGSGKTTTLYSILSKISTTKVNTMTIEDPVEYQIPGVNQVQVNPAAGLTFASALRSFLRQDPDIIMVGEIRDEETTELVIHAALTGHLVFSTLHTNDAAGAPPRLIDLGAAPFLLVSALTCVVGQRVLRRICPHCKEEFTPLPKEEEEIKKVLGPLFAPALAQQQKQTGRNHLVLWRGRGCSECNNTGYYGRIGIFEVMPISDQIIKLILEKASAGKIETQARKEGMITMKQDGYLKALEGITTIEEVIRVAEF